MQLSYSDAVRALASLHWISEAGEGAFRARLRKLQGEGIPEGANPGKGKRVDYTIPMLIEMAIAIELLQCGLSPFDAANLIKANRSEFLFASLFSIGSVRDVRRDVSVLISPEALRPYSVNASDAQDYLIGAVSFVSRTQLVELFMKRKPYEPVTGESWRWSVINLGDAMVHLISQLDADGEGDGSHAFNEEVLKWEAEIKRFVKERLNRIIVSFEEGEHGD